MITLPTQLCPEQCNTVVAERELVEIQKNLCSCPATVSIIPVYVPPPTPLVTEEKPPVYHLCFDDLIYSMTSTKFCGKIVPKCV